MKSGCAGTKKFPEELSKNFLFVPDPVPGCESLFPFRFFSSFSVLLFWKHKIDGSLPNHFPPRVPSFSSSPRFSAQHWEPRPPREGQGRGGANRSGRALLYRRVAVRTLWRQRTSGPAPSICKRLCPRLSGLSSIFLLGLWFARWSCCRRGRLHAIPCPSAPGVSPASPRGWARSARSAREGGCPAGGDGVGFPSRVARPPSRAWTPPAPPALLLQALPPEPQWHHPRPPGLFLQDTGHVLKKWEPSWRRA